VRENLTLLAVKGFFRMKSDSSYQPPFVVVSAHVVELFRYRYHAENGREFEYVSQTDEQSTPKTVSEEKAAEIAAEWVTTFYHLQVGTIESQEFRTRPIPHWLFSFSNTIKGPIDRMFFVVLLPSGIVVQPKLAERLLG
jgi:hypothetical protein